MRNPVELVLDGLRNFRMPVTMEIRPDGRIRVNVLRAGHIAQHSALPRFNDDRFLFQPLFHLRERMPKILVVCFS